MREAPVTPPLSRNTPCPCGSGKRYKHCHGLGASSEMATPEAAPEADAATRLSRAATALGAGQPQLAERLLRQLLEQTPQSAEAWHMLGQSVAAQGRLPEALIHFRQARQSAPQEPALATSEIRAELALGHHAMAQEHAQRLASAHPQLGEAWLLLGLCSNETQPEAALQALQRALSCAPENPECCFELARLQHDMGRFSDAAATLRAGLAHHPDNALLLNNYGLALRRLGQTEEAEQAWRNALQANPGLVQARANLGQLLVETGRHAAALPLLEPTSPELAGSHEYWLSLGLAHIGLGHVEAATNAFVQALRYNPGDAKINYNLGTAYLQAQRLDLARTYLEAAHALDPEDAKVELLLLDIAQRSCDWTSYRRLMEKLPVWLEQAETLRPTPHAMLARPLTGSQLLRVAKAFAETLGPLARAPQTRPSAHARLRLGYVTTTIRNHPMPSLIAELLERHDRARVEVYLYSCGPQDASPYRPRIAAAIEHFLEMQHASDDDLFARIRSDEIDVLVDLDGYTQFTRSRVFRRRPAPIQVNYIGFPGSLGAPCYDYLVADRETAPPQYQADFSERLLYMPHCYLPSDTRRRLDVPQASRAQLGLAGASFVYCAFNSTYKLAPTMFSIWLRILNRVPGSVLWMLTDDRRARENLAREATEAGIDPNRLIFASAAPLSEHLARYPLADLFLDTLPCNAHTTCNDALLMGLPVLTCRGQTFSGRVAGSQLLAAGLPELVTEDLAAYEAMAVRLGQSPDELAILRTRLVEQGLASALFDMGAYTRAFEDLLLGAHAEAQARGGS